MTKNIVKIDGMACGMCEAHITDVIRRLYPKATKVSASHKKGEAVFVTDEPADEETVKEAIDKTGYHFKGFSTEEYKKKGLFGGLF